MGFRESDQDYHAAFVISTINVISTIFVCLCLGAGVTSRVACAGISVTLTLGVWGERLHWHWECGVSAYTGSQ